MDFFDTVTSRSTFIAECTNLPGSARECRWNNPGPVTSSGILRVVARDAATGGSGDASATISIRPGGVPPGWTPRDIGSVAAPGSATMSGTTVTVNGSGADIWGSADELHFAYREVSRNFDVIARVASITNVNAWTKAGLMIRESVAAGSRHASVFATPTTQKGVAFQRRPATNGISVHTAGAAVGPPVYLRLARLGDVVSAYYRTAPDAPWIVIGQQTLTNLPENVLVGLAVSSHIDGRIATATFDGVNVNVHPLQSYDIGAVGVLGTTTFGAAGTTIEGSGADIWGTADAFRYYARPASGDSTITVRVKSIENTHGWAKAGVMIRESLAPGSKHVMAIVSAGKGLAVQYRGTTSGTSANAALQPGAAPEWLRLTRTGPRITAFASEDGTTWRTLGSAFFPMAADVYAGLVVTSHNNATLATGVFSDLNIAP